MSRLMRLTRAHADERREDFEPVICGEVDPEVLLRWFFTRRAFSITLWVLYDDLGAKV